MSSTIKKLVTKKMIIKNNNKSWNACDIETVKSYLEQGGDVNAKYEVYNVYKYTYSTVLWNIMN
jgi:hypothetical protein